MNTRNDTGFRTFLVGSGGVTRNTRVKTPAAIVVAGAGEDALGIALETVAAGGYCAVKLFSAPGTFACVAAGPVTASAPVYGAASGKIDDAVSGNKIGTALEAAAADGDVIEVLPANVGDLFAVQAHVVDAAQTQTALTDNGGGTADATVADQSAPATLTDNTGDSATHDDTLQVVTTPTLSDWNGTSVHPSAAQGTAINDAIGALRQNESDLAQKIKELVTLAGTAQNNLKECTAELALIKTDNANLISKFNTVLANLEANGIHLSA